MAGYSRTPLPKKLGIEEGHRVALLGAPEGFGSTLGTLPEGVLTADRLIGSDPFDVIVLFVTRRADLEKRFAQAAKRLTSAGGLWVAWPKRASKIPTDLTEDVVRQIALAAGLVDVKVCAIDDVWSGLRCVARVEDRPAAARPPDARASVGKELDAALRRSAKAKAAFAGMPPSHRREVIAWLAEAKKPETRARRIAQAVARLERGGF